MATLEDQLVAHLSETRFEHLPAEAVEAARRCILDTLGVVVAGSSGDDIEALIQWLQSRGGPAEATALVYGARLPAPHAAWANGAMARAREFDDSHDATGDHTSVPILSAALAAAELQGGASGRDFLAAYVLAADFTSRLRLAPTTRVGGTAFAANTFAPFSAAVAAGRLLGLRGERLSHALGWAYAQCAGSVQLQQGGGSALHLHHGLASASGVQAALLARHGLPGTEQFLSGKFGLFNAYAGGDYNLQALTDGLGDRYEIAQVSIKQYPSGRVTHGPIDAALALRAEERLDPSDIVEVGVVYTRGGYNMTCEPLAERRVPNSVQHAKFSLAYNLACALARGHVDLEDFTPQAIADPTVRDLAARVEVLVDPQLTDVIPPGMVSVQLKDGRLLQRVVNYPKGTPENPVSFRDCVAKLHRCLAFAARPLEPGAVEAAVRMVSRLEAVEDVRALVELCTCAAPR
ncbi:MAG: MmgE/PrpD family protein [Chloroflexi bacterium]|nr:MmgE/PrpD family protein [Chloroflexota bacterium]